MKQGKLQIAENEARKFKEDCHRLAGEAGSAVVYYAPGGIHATRVFVFSPSSQPGIRISFSKDGRTFEPVESAVVRTVTHGEDAYGFRKALLFSASPGPEDSDYVKIEFVAEAQLSRIEIDHDRAE